MAREFGEGKDDSRALDNKVIELNLALLEHRIQSFFPTIKELEEKGLSLDAPLSTPALFWYFGHERLYEGLIVDLLPLGLSDEIEKVEQAYATAMDLEFIQRGEIFVSSGTSVVGGKAVREYKIEKEGYFDIFKELRRDGIRNNVQRRLYSTLERFNTAYELSRL